MTLKRYPSRWAIMAAALFFMSFGGTCYSFGLISDTIKSRLSLTQSQIDLIAVVGQIGAGSTVIPGVVNNKYGPSVSVWFGVVIITVAWGALTILTTQIIDISSLSYSYIIIAICAFFYNHGLVWFSGIAAPTIAQNFPRCDHGKYLGLAKGYLGLGSAYIATFKSDLASGDVNVFMWSVVAYVPIFGLIFSWFLVQIPDKKYVMEYRNGENPQRWKLWYLCSCLLALYLITMVVLQDIFDLKTIVPGYYIEVGIGLYLIAQILWYSPMFLAMCNHGQFWLHFDDKKGDKEDGENPLLIQNEERTLSEEIEGGSDIEDIGMPQIFKTWDFWLLYLPFIIIAGSGLTLIANVAQIVESALSDKNGDHKNDGITTSMVTVISCGNFVGRIVAGWLSDKYIHKYHRVFWNIFSAFGMTLSTLYIFGVGYLFDGHKDTTIILLLIGCFIIGISYGWIFSVCLASTCHLWGTKYLSGNYAVFDTCGAIGQIIFSNIVFASIYTHHGKDVEHDGTKCYGNECFQYAFLICSGSCIVALIMTITLWRMHRK